MKIYGWTCPNPDCGYHRLDTVSNAALAKIKNFNEEAFVAAFDGPQDAVLEQIEFILFGRALDLLPTP